MQLEQRGGKPTEDWNSSFSLLLELELEDCQSTALETDSRLSL